MWGSPNQPFIDGCSIINHPFWGVPHFRKLPYVYNVLLRLSKVSKVSKVSKPSNPSNPSLRLELSEFQREVVDHGARKLHDLGIQPILCSPWRRCGFQPTGETGEIEIEIFTATKAIKNLDFMEDSSMDYFTRVGVFFSLVFFTIRMSPHLKANENIGNDLLDP